MSVWRIRAPAPWNDRSGRFSVLKAATLVGAVLPAAWLLRGVALDKLGPLPLGPLVYHTGVFALWFLLLALAITPARRLFGARRLILIRRMAGVTGFAYVLAHLAAYVLLRQLDWPVMGREIVTRLSLMAAMVATLGLAALAATSTDAAIRRMGGGWSRLHRLAYPAIGLGIFHYVMSPGSLAGQPFLMVGLFLWLMGWRWIEARGAGRRVWALAGLAVAVALSTALIEAVAVGWFHGYGVVEVLASNLRADLGLPAAWSAFLAAGGVVVARLGWALAENRR